MKILVVLFLLIPVIVNGLSLADKKEKVQHDENVGSKLNEKDDEVKIASTIIPKLIKLIKVEQLNPSDEIDEKPKETYLVESKNYDPETSRLLIEVITEIIHGLIDGGFITDEQIEAICDWICQNYPCPPDCPGYYEPPWGKK